MDDEYNADYVAFLSMYEGKPDQVKCYSSLGIILALGSQFFCDETLGGETHPDPDDRLGKIIAEIDNELDDRGKDYCYGMAVTLYKMWAYYYSKELWIPKVKKAENMKEYFSLIQKAFSNNKSKSLFKNN